jgi:hypothetical protein
MQFVFVAFRCKLLVCMLHFISKRFHSNDDFMFSLSFCLIAIADSPCFINVHILYFFFVPLELLVLVFKNAVSLWVCNFYYGSCEFMVNDLKINLSSSLLQQCIVQNKWEITFGQFLVSCRHPSWQENCAVIGNYTVRSDIYLLTFWDLSFPSSSTSWRLKMDATGCYKMLVRNYHYSLHNGLGRSQFSSVSWQKPEIMHGHIC